ncbi:MAG: 3-phosphoshikimate 1-carboxyvinyltransferase [Chloroherpetonaceae bacterium]|nr:3-phosphoshikimate 1-carboxyvinyltransferase [Chloroherpetonaceae bacterium]MCS7211671.1 3-phosphoshikimate 1-carboxyvinyltransferase [Chloroherpetonaceae bacterium]MDW8018547.1 3-phosphoshikimate 1-carboxyvinyltransferase [Chloroherpetonaceae bacterium]
MNPHTLRKLTITGTVNSLPPDKSISHRAALIAALAHGTSHIDNFSGGLDNQTTLQALAALGLEVVQTIHNDRRTVRIRANGLWSLKPAANAIECHNSGSTMRMLAGILAAQPFSSVLIGDASLMRRPMKRIADPLSAMGAEVALSPAQTAPIRITGSKHLRPISYTSPIASAQVKSAIIFAALHADGTSEIIEPACSRDHTERMLGLERECLPNGYYRTRVSGIATLPARHFVIPADPSAAAFLIALALLADRSELVLQRVCLNPTRIAYLDLLRAAGACIAVESVQDECGEPVGSIVVTTSKLTTPLCISGKQTVASVIDEIPMLAMLSALATERFELQNAEELRTKESDRIAALVKNLRRMGFECEEYPDGFLVRQRKFVPSAPVHIETFGDHRIAMAFHIASYCAGAELVLSEVASIPVSFPNFFEVLKALITA